MILLVITALPMLLAAHQGDSLQAEKPKNSLFNTMYHQDILPVTLELDIEKLLANRRTKEKMPATLSFKDANGQLQEWGAKVQVRGKFRRIACEDIPPLKLDFSKKDLAAAGLAKFDDLKLVTHCVEDDYQAKQLLLKEYLAYKLYNQLTEESFRVQFLKIIYIDSKTGSKKKKYGFFIEDTAELRNRIEASKWENPMAVDSTVVNQKQLMQVALFECMIGNADWNFKTGHNVKTMTKAGQVIFIPYDFDFSGLVKAPYARLNSSVGQSSLDDRIFMSYTLDVEKILHLRNELKSYEDKFIKTIKKVKALDVQSRSESIAYVKQFFKSSTPIKLPEDRLAFK